MRGRSAARILGGEYKNCKLGAPNLMMWGKAHFAGALTGHFQTHECKTTQYNRAF